MPGQRLGQDAVGVEQSAYPAEQLRLACLDRRGNLLGRVHRLLYGYLALPDQWVLEGEDDWSAGVPRPVVETSGEWRLAHVLRAERGVQLDRRVDVHAGLSQAVRRRPELRRVGQRRPRHVV